MRAMAIDRFGGTDVLRQMALPRPKPEAGEVLIHVVAAGVNPVDCEIRQGKLEQAFPHRFPLIPGWEAAGVIEELGAGATRFRKGDRVFAYARKPTIQWGCYAEYVAVPEKAVAMMPAKLLYEEAAAVPLAGLTAYQCLFGQPGLDQGKTVLIHRAGGGVGHFAVQLARNVGARVLGTAGAGNQPFVLELGAELGIDYTRDDFREVVRRECPDGVDLVLDAVGGETLERSLDVIRPGGRLVSVMGTPDAGLAAERGITAHTLLSEPDGEQLTRLARLFDVKKIRVEVQQIFMLGDAADAHEAIEQGHVRGKLVLNL